MVIYPLTTVLHDIREQLGLDLDSFTLGQYYFDTRLINTFQEPASVASQVLGINSTGRVTKAQQLLIREGFLQKNGKDMNMTDKWRLSILIQQSGQKVAPKATDLALVFLTALDQELKKAKITNAPKPNPNNKISLKAAKLRLDAIIRVHPTVNETAVQMVAAWAVAAWGKRPEMVVNIRTSTLLRSPSQFLRYLDNAQSYFS